MRVRLQSRLGATSLLLGLVALLFAAPPALAKDVTYYASPDGVGGCSSPSDSCGLATALSLAASDSSTGAAVTITLAGGDYDSSSAPPVSVTSGSEASLTIDGTGAANLVGDHAVPSAVLDDAAFPIELKNLTLADGETSTGSGGNASIPSGTVTLDDVNVSGGVAPCGAGISFGGTGLTIVDSTITQNIVPASIAGSCGEGAGIWSDGGVLTLVDSTVSQNDNNTGSYGGGIAASGTSVTIDDSTLAANTCDWSNPCLGGALYLTGGAAGRVFGSTIADSTNTQAQLTVDPGSSLELGADILSGDGVPNCSAGSAPPTDAGYNLADDSSCSLSATTTRESVSDASLALGLLAYNGGSNQTVQISHSSVAHDAIPTDTTLSGQSARFCAGSDERGASRGQPDAATCDVGAYQIAPPVLTGISPSAAESGINVEITGTNLEFVTDVGVGSSQTPAAIQAQSDEALVITIPGLLRGSQPVTVTSPDGSATLPFTVVTGPSIVTASLPEAEVGVPYSRPLQATGGADPLTWAQGAGVVPSGLSLSPGGTVSGVPKTSGTTSFTAVVRDADGVSATRQLSLTTVSPVRIATTRLPDATAYEPYRGNLAAAAGTGQGPLMWSIVSGSLPPGLTLDSQGVISGIPRSPGIRTLNVLVRDALGGTAQMQLGLVISSAPRPQLSRLKETNSIFTVRARRTPLNGQTARATASGTVFSFVLNEHELDYYANIGIEIERLTRLVCEHHRRPAPCLQASPIGALNRIGRPGANRVTFTGRIGRKALAPGHYRAVFTAQNIAGRSRSRAIAFTIQRVAR